MLGLVTGKLTGIDQGLNEFKKSTGNLEIVFLFLFKRRQAVHKRGITVLRLMLSSRGVKILSPTRAL